MNDDTHMEEALLKKIRAWHESERRSCIERTFALGDLIVSAVIHTGMTEYQIIQRIIADLGPVAMGQTCYNRAARMARVFTGNQRQILITHAVSIGRCEILAGDFYDGRKRIKVIADIKAGKCTAPWAAIKGYKEFNRSKRADDDPERQMLRANSDVHMIVSRPFDADKIQNVLAAILSDVKTGRAPVSLQEFDELVREAKRQTGLSTK